MCRRAAPPRLFRGVRYRENPRASYPRKVALVTSATEPRRAWAWTGPGTDRHCLYCILVECCFLIDPCYHMQWEVPKTIKQTIPNSTILTVSVKECQALSIMCDSIIRSVPTHNNIALSLPDLHTHTKFELNRKPRSRIEDIYDWSQEGARHTERERTSSSPGARARGLGTLFGLADTRGAASFSNPDELAKSVKLTSRERRFIKFASVEHGGQLYMTPQDFLESVVEQEPRPRLKRRILTVKEIEQLRDHTPPLKKGSPQMFRSLRDKEPASGFRIAFNMFDTDGNQRVDKNEFLVIQRLLGGSIKERNLDAKSEEAVSFVRDAVSPGVCDSL
ncbi:Calcium uptake protein 3, mitochondrial [Eumeta japonica]|uniref:Calcium uptake protein 3, mitochondrial n=1 Tax=Eumeta variegata TaxID=151549 RepID=A0A4C1Z1Z3_EUMVA|nr:Calcium uptake protein 3, mitochondrial [Eumeta japonica]